MLDVTDVTAHWEYFDDKQGDTNKKA